MDALTARPAAALPAACASRTDPASRFRDNPQVTPANRRAAHSADTVARGAAADDPVVRAWDTTGLDFRMPLRRSAPVPVAATAIGVTAFAPPAGGAGLSWLLLTTRTVTDAATAWRGVGYYAVRWRVEQ